MKNDKKEDEKKAAVKSKRAAKKSMDSISSEVLLKFLLNDDYDLVEQLRK